MDSPRPDAEGYWWLQEHDHEWRVVRVRKFVEMSGPSYQYEGGWRLVSSSQGRWRGPLVPPPT